MYSAEDFYVGQEAVFLPCGGDEWTGHYGKKGVVTAVFEDAVRIHIQGIEHKATVTLGELRPLSTKQPPKGCILDMKIIKAATTKELEKECKEWIDDGWSLHCGFRIVDGAYVQQIVKYS